MKKRWKDVMAGFVTGILVVLVGNILLCRTDENAGEYLSKMQEVQQGYKTTPRISHIREYGNPAGLYGIVWRTA